MSKFCGQCGAQLNDDATFCTNCGAQLNVNQAAGFQNGAAVQSNPAQNVKNAMGGAVDKLKNSKYKNYILLGGIGVVVLIVLIILLSLIFGGGSYETPLKNYVKVCEKGDTKAYREMIPMNSDMEEAMESIAKLSGMDLDEYYEEAATDIKEDLEDKYGDGLKVSYKVTDKEELDEDELEDISGLSLSSLLGSSSKKKKNSKITEGYKLEVEFTYKGDDKEKTKTEDVTVIKFDGKWCIADASMNIH